MNYEQNIFYNTFIMHLLTLMLVNNILIVHVSLQSIN